MSTDRAAAKAREAARRRFAKKFYLNMKTLKQVGTGETGWDSNCIWGKRVSGGSTGDGGVKAAWAAVQNVPRMICRA